MSLISQEKSGILFANDVLILERDLVLVSNRRDVLDSPVLMIFRFVLACFSLALAPVSPVQGQTPPLVIHEFLAVNGKGLVDKDGDFSDWIEIRNVSDKTVNIEGWYLSDDPGNPTKWTAPLASIVSDGFLIVFCSGKDNNSIFQKELHTNFTVSRKSGYLSLADPDGVVVQEVQYPDQRTDVTYSMNEEGGYSFAQPTPAKPNGSYFRGMVKDTKFSVDRGVFAQGFEVEISCATEDARIIYTTNGDEPGEGTIFTGLIGEDYEGPIRIDGTTVLRAAAFKEGYLPSNVDTQTYLFLEQVVRQPAEPAGFPDRWINFPADYEMDPRVIDDPAYKDEAVAALASLPSMSVVMPVDELFSARDGIYANSTEREASVELIHFDGTKGFQENCGVRIHGFGWRPHTNTAKHSFRLEFRERFGKTKLDYKLFPDAPVDRFDSIVLRSQGSKGWQDFRDPEQTQYLHDAFARDLAQDMGKIDGHSTFVHLYLNGLYWGLYNPVERPDGDFGEEYFGGEAAEYDAINRRTTTNEAVDGNLDAYNEMIALAQRGVNSLGDYEAIRDMLDIDDLIDYMLIHQYTTNRDGPEEFNSNNMRGLRRRVPGGQFRFFVWDMEYSLWNVERNINIDVAIPGSISFVYSRLRNSPEFRLRYGDHVRKHLFNNGALTPDRVLARWNQRSDQIFSALIGESARWGDAKRPSRPYTRDVEWAEERRRLVEEYFPDRTRILIDQLKAADLYSSTQAPDFNQHGGRVVPGFHLIMTAGTLFQPQAGDFYYTTDGRDPRIYGVGEIAPTALVYDRNGPGIDLSESVTIKARTYYEGNWSALNEAVFVMGVLPTPETLKISEIHYRPASPTADEIAAGFERRSDFEFLEIYNAGADALDLTSLEFSRGLKFSFHGIDTLDLTPGSTALLVRNKEAMEFRYGVGLPVIGEFTRSKLNDGGETITLALTAGEIIQEITYDDQVPWPESADGDGYSLTLTDPSVGADVSDPSNSRASTMIGGSPGVVESGDGPASSAVSPILLSKEMIEVDGKEEPYWVLVVDKTVWDGGYELEVTENLEDWRSNDTGFVSLDSNETAKGCDPNFPSLKGRFMKCMCGCDSWTDDY